MIENALDEIKIKEKLKKRNDSLIKRFDEDFSKYRGDLFQMPVEEGKWESATSNRAQSEGWKIINLLASARRKIFIFNENKDDANNRNIIANTEHVANGLLSSYDRQNDGLTDTPDLQATMAFFAVVRGWRVYRLLCTEGDDNNPYLDLMIGDIRNTFWIPGRKRLLKVYYDRWASKEEILDEYPGWNGKEEVEDPTGKTPGLICVTDVWDCTKSKTDISYAKEAVIIDKEFVKEPEFVEVGGQKLEYLPWRIKAGGTTPLISDNNNDNIKHVGESYLVNTRNIHEPASRLLSYSITRAGLEAKAPTVIVYDSTKGELPPEFEKDPNVKGSFIFLDEGKGQKIGDPLPMSNGNLINQAQAMLQQQYNIGGLSLVAYGTDTSLTAYGTDVLNKNTREHVTPFKNAIESDYQWIAAETIRQYKMGSYNPTEFEGIDQKFNRFKARVKPEDVDANRNFVCELIVDELRDRTTNSGLAIQEVKAGLLSLREALDIHQLSEDPDRTIELIEQELAEKAFDTPVIKGYLLKIKDLAELIKKGKDDPLKRFEIDHAIKKLQLLGLQQESAINQLEGAQQIVGKNPVLEANRTKGLNSRIPQPNMPSNVQIPQQVKDAARGGV